MKNDKKTTNQIYCPVCDNLIELQKMIRDDEDRLLCQDCLAENESCGCSDEEQQH